jgi:ATP-binding cassette subfamily B protein
LFTKPEIISPSQDEFTFNDKIEFKNVAYTYPGKVVPALQNLNFTIYKGSRFGILGSTGSGKTSLLNLLLRSFDVNEG